MWNQRFQVCGPVVIFGLALIVDAGCIFNGGGTDEDDAGTAVDAGVEIDAMDVVVDAGIDAPRRCDGWPDDYRLHFDPCASDFPEPMSPAPLVLDAAGTYMIDTDTGALTDPDGVAVPHAGVQVGTSWVMSVEVLEIADGTTLRAEGQRSLMVAAWDEIRVAGVIDVSSNESDGPGAGANPMSACSAHQAGNGAQDDNGGGGGGGGGFGSPGGIGGEGFDRGGTPGNRGNAIAQPDEEVRGGCAGGSGGDGADAGGLGSGGDGGGAVQLTAWNLVTITAEGRINAGGQGGNGANGSVSSGAGGGGGGSGGFIGLEGPVVNVATGAILAANGGGGGQGTDTSTGSSGQDALLGLQSAAGGVIFGTGPSGGAGAALNNGTQAASGSNAVSDGSGGGGGGGGVGWIMVHSGDIGINGATLSPNYTQIAN